MPDALTDHDRAAIAAYRGKVKKIPARQSGITDETYRWIPGKSADADGFVIGGTHWKKQRDGFMRRRSRDMRFQALKRREVKADIPPTPREAQNDAIALRRDAVRQLTFAGLLQTEIAERLGANVNTISWDVAQMRKAGDFPSPQECRAIRRRRGLA